MLNPVPSPTPSDSKKDFPWLTDIEKIQAEIERDLEMIKSPHSSSPQAGTSSLIWEEPKPDTWVPVKTEPDIEASPPDINATSASGAGFYRETIKDKHRHSFSWAKTVAVILLVCIFGMSSLGFGIGAAYSWFTERDIVPPVEITTNNEAPTIASNRYTFDTEGHSTGTVADMVALLEPAVVSITTRFEEGNRPSIAGSGTIFGDNENRIFIVTGYYVVPNVAGAQHHVRISGSRPLLARIVDSDRRSGLAVISIDKTQLLEANIESYTIANFGDSSLMQVGDVVFAMGNARNEGISVTRGIVSAGKQEIVFPEYTLTVLQTDAAINYGSSGGPLINMRGEVIGINIDRAIMLFGAAVEGIGYSIASNVVEPFLDALVSPTRPGLGIMGRTVSEELALEFNIPPMGVQVVTVFPGGAAEAAGIQPYDVITAFGGEPIFIMEELQYAIRQQQIDDVVEVRILRDGTTPITLEVVFRAFIQ